MPGPTPFPILGQALPIELANTVYRGSRTIIEGLRTPDDLAVWLDCHADALWAPAPRADEVLLQSMVQLRGRVRQLLIARADRRPPPVGAVTALNRAAEAAPYSLRLSWRKGAEPRLARTSTATPSEQLSAEIAEATLLLVADPDADRLYRCLGPGCIGVFLQGDARRRYCSPPCSNRARAARHYAHTRT